jgi:catechol 2,3-dioxygenase-like lactoylglutathione lyase family enzyme
MRDACPMDDDAAPSNRFRSFSPVFPVRDLRRALAHYTSLGFEVEPSADGEGDGYGFAQRDEVSLHLSLDGGHGPEVGHQHVGTAYLHIEDADALYDEWARPGVGGLTRRVGDTPYRLREGSHVDPDGNLIRFGSPMPGRPGERLRAHLETRYGIRVAAMTELDLSVWRVGRVAGPDWVARAFPARRSAEAVAGDAAILRYLAARGFPAERCAADEPVSVLGGRAVLVTEWASPVPRHQRRDAIRAAGGLSHLGALLGRLHTLDTRPAARAGGNGIISPTGCRRRRSRPPARCSPGPHPSFPMLNGRRSTRSGRRSPRWTRRRDCPRGSSTRISSWRTSSRRRAAWSSSTGQAPAAGRACGRWRSSCTRRPRRIRAGQARCCLATGSTSRWKRRNSTA